jgi:hypothetical protein
MRTPDQLRQLAEAVRADAADADEGVEESRLMADLLDAAASEDFVEFADIRLVRRCVDALAVRLEVALAEETTR